MIQLAEILGIACSGPRIGFDVRGETEQLCTFKDLISLVYQVIKIAFYAAPIVATIFIIWGAFVIITSGGNAGRLVSGRKTIILAVVGLLVVWGAFIIVTTIFWVLGVEISCPGGAKLEWYQYRCPGF